jgi:GntR family transcriptional regulator, transcriptional repressor for pyruvate dehydrogenase complex
MESSFLTPVARTTVTSDVCRKLVAHLVRGDWQEGDRLPSERELGRLLGVGRASLREALKALEIMGMVESRVGNGTFVCHRSEFLARPMLWSITGSDQTQVHELIEARRLMEGELAALAAERGTAEDLQEIALQIGRMEQGIANTELFLDADLEFHLAIGQAAHNRLLLNAVQLIRNLMRQWMGETLQVPDTASEALRQHKEIFKAISGKDKEGARSAMDLHLDAMAKLLLRVRGATPSRQVPA